MIVRVAMPVGQSVVTAGTPNPASIEDLFLRRLEEIERRVSSELDRPTVAGGPLEALLLDLGRALWRGTTGAVHLLTHRAELAKALALLLAARPTDELGINGPRARTVAEVLRLFGRFWLGLDGCDLACIPQRGGVLVLLNRSPWPLPVEALLLWSQVVGAASKDRPVYVLWEFGAPFVGSFLEGIGAFAASRENCRLLLERGAVVIGFPEGRAARSKTYDRRYRLAPFHDGFLVDAAVTAAASILPGAVLGSEESYPVLGWLGSFPVTPLFPFAGLLGLLPLPLRWSLKLGPVVEYPQVETGQADTDALSDAVRARMQALLAELAASRNRR